MSGKTLYLEGLDELEPDDVLYWLKETLARDLAAVRVPKSEEERMEVLRYAWRRLEIGLKKVTRAIDASDNAPYVPSCVWLVADRGHDDDLYYDQDGDPPWDRLPDWAAS